MNDTGDLYSHQKARLRNEILWELETNHYDKDVMPHYGLVPDWGPRYDRLAKLLWEYLDAEGTILDEQERKARQAKRHLQRESTSSSGASQSC